MLKENQIKLLCDECNSTQLYKVKPKFIEVDGQHVCTVKFSPECTCCSADISFSMLIKKDLASGKILEQPGILGASLVEHNIKPLAPTHATA